MDEPVRKRARQAPCVYDPMMANVVEPGDPRFSDDAAVKFQYDPDRQGYTCYNAADLDRLYRTEWRRRIDDEKPVIFDPISKEGLDSSKKREFLDKYEWTVANHPDWLEGFEITEEDYHNMYDQTAEQYGDWKWSNSWRLDHQYLAKNRLKPVPEDPYWNCMNDDGIDPVTLEPLTDYKPIDVMKLEVFPGDSERKRCYHANSLNRYFAESNRPNDPMSRVEVDPLTGLLANSATYQIMRDGRGRKMREGPMENGQMHGLWTWYYPDGHTKKYEVEIVHGVRHGAYRKYHENGTVAESAQIENGHIHGIFAEYHDNGKLRSETHYVHGKKQGQMMRYSDSGVRIAMVTFENDVEQGPFEEYYPNGNLRRRGQNVNRKWEVLLEEFYEDGVTPKAEYTMSNGMPIGPFKKFYESGKLSLEGTFDDDSVRHGPYKEYFENGVVKAEGQYDRGLRNGHIITRYDTGEKESESYYEKGKSVGLWRRFDKAGNVIRATQYHDNGRPAVDGYYENNKRHGTWQEFFENGRLMRESHYVHGKLDGPWHEYTKKDILVVTGQYANGMRTDAWTFFNPRGHPLRLGSYLHDKKHGQWIEFHETLQAKKRVDHFDMGQLHGKSTSYYPNGKVHETGEYVHGKKHGEWLKYDENGETTVEKFDHGHLLVTLD